NQGLGARDGAAGLAQLAGVVQLLRRLLHAQVEVGLLQVLDFSLQSGNVFLTQFSGVHCSCSSRYWPTMRVTNVVRSGSLAAASWNASRARASGTPTISYRTLPGWISAT